MRWCIVVMSCMLGGAVFAQQPLPQEQEQQVENLAEREVLEVDDDAYLQELEHFRKRKINLNRATTGELERLQLLNALQVQALLQYRMLLGPLIHLYELQAVPHWDVSTIQNVLPYVSVEDEKPIAQQLAARLHGDGMLLLRLSQSFPRSPDFDDTTAAGYAGSPQKILVRYRYNYKNVLQWGVLADKDAGEPLFTKKQPTGFDFYSAHLFVRNLGLIQSLAVGDFAVNLGQGLVQWQSMGFRKSTEITAIKRQSAVLRPYSSAGEYNFHRGLGVTMGKKRLSLTVFASRRKLDANLGVDAAGNAVITSFLTGGLHRTSKEIEKRNNVRQLAGGVNLRYKGNSWQVGASSVAYHFSNAVQKREEPYNYYALAGRRLANFSLDYDCTLRNLHLFGELAAGPGLQKGLIQGLLVSLDRRVDASLVVRHLESGFQSLYATAFTESSAPGNESGLFLGLSARPVAGVKVDLYADVFRFPWLRYRVDGPSAGREFLVQLTYRPDKRVELVSRLRLENKQFNDMQEVNNTINLNQFLPNRLYDLRFISKLNWRLHTVWQASASVRLHQRVEMVWYDRGGPAAEMGYLIYNDVTWQPVNQAFDLGSRVQLFETDGFNSRIYAFENDVPSSYTVSAIHQKGWRYYVNLKLDLLRLAGGHFGQRMPATQLFLRWGQTVAGMRQQPAIQPFRSGECKVQVIFSGF